MLLFKSVLHNIGVIFVGIVFALIGYVLDLAFHFHSFRSVLTIVIGTLCILIGFLIRLWATYYFYKEHMKVIVLHPQGSLITTGPFAYSRHPLYIGGNVFIFMGASLVLGSPMAVFLTIAHLPLVNFMMKREEKQLAQRFGKQWTEYTKHTRRWI